MLNLLAAALLAAAAADQFVLAGRVEDPALSELSGLAASRARPGVFWAHNDSGNAARLFAIDHRGQLLQALPLRGARNIDWEDLAWFEERGAPYLAVGDIGDNLGWRAFLTVYIVAEPGAAADAATPVRRIEFTYEDGPRDAEALAVDAAAGRILVMEKARPPAGLYELPLHVPDGERVVARRVAELQLGAWNPEPPARVQSLGTRKYRDVATSMDLSRDGRRLLVLTYSHLLRFERAPGQAWDAALQRAPLVVRAPRRSGLEAACFDADDRSVWVAREGRGAHLYWSPLDATR